MLKAHQFNIEHLPTVKTYKSGGKEKIEYLNLECAFDIETTSLERDNEKFAFMYAWAIGFGHDQPIYYGRNWIELKLILDDVVEHYQLDDLKRIIIYVHNLSYEFQFIRKHFNWLDVFAINERKVLKAVTMTGIEFRCSYMLSGYSLDGVAKNLQKYDYSKKIGDLDYSLARHMHTPLTEKELGYIEYDIKIVTGYISEQLDIYGTITKIPLTNTGRVRQYVRNRCYYTSNTHKKTDHRKYWRYRELMETLTLTPHEYELLKNAFMGGFTHANAIYSNQVLENISSYDLSSSYPAVMITEKFPMSRGEQVEYKSVKEFENDFTEYAVVFEMRLENVTSAILQENYISESKCLHLEDATLNNGRVVSAKSLSMAVTEIDYQIIKATYNYDEIYVKNAYRYRKGYLPKAIIESILDLYQDKTKLKNVAGRETDYLLSKGMLNSIYGMTVTDIVRDDIIYTSDDEWKVEGVSIEDEIEKYNQSKNRFLFYQWGVYTTAYARRNLWTGIMSMDLDYVYSDTDSIKFKNVQSHKDYIEKYNAIIEDKLERMADELKIDRTLFKPKDIEGNEHLIGVWDYEGTYDRFKTLGAKRYLIEENGKYSLTVAGLPKKHGLEYLLKTGQPFDYFSNNMTLNRSESGKNAHTYIDDVKTLTFTDYKGNTCTMIEQSSIHLGSIEFTLSIGERYLNYLDEVKAGITNIGVGGSVKIL